MASWCTHHADHLTGVNEATRARCRRYIANDIAPSKIGPLPLAALRKTDAAKRVNSLTGSAKAAANKHGFLSGALNSAMRSGHLKANPCDGNRLGRDEPAEMVFLTNEEFTLLHSCFGEHWKPLVEFLAASGARFGEATALKPGDVPSRKDRENSTCVALRASGGLSARARTDKAEYSHHRRTDTGFAQPGPFRCMGLHELRSRLARSTKRSVASAKPSLQRLGSRAQVSQGQGLDQAAPHPRSASHQRQQADSKRRAVAGDPALSRPWVDPKHR